MRLVELREEIEGGDFKVSFSIQPNVRADISQNADLGHTPHSHHRNVNNAVTKYPRGFLVGHTVRPKE